MVDRDTASACRALARLRSGVRRSVAAAAPLGLLAGALAPPAGADVHGCAHAHAPVGATSRHRLQIAVVCLVNHQRTRRHLPRLRISQRLNRSAQDWTDTMVRDNNFSHGSDFAARISAVGFKWSMAGENIASGYDTPASVVRAWMGSAGHCENILSPSFADVGTGIRRRGVAGSGSAGTWTQDFALPMGHHRPSHHSGPAQGCPY